MKKIQNLIHVDTTPLTFRYRNNLESLECRLSPEHILIITKIRTMHRMTVFEGKNYEPQKILGSLLFRDIEQCGEKALMLVCRYCPPELIVSAALRFRIGVVIQ